MEVKLMGIIRVGLDRMSSTIPASIKEHIVILLLLNL
jgi:hypothetical protein